MCDNTKTYYVDKGLSYVEVQVQCGTTDPYGSRALCERCESDPRALREHLDIIENEEADNAWLRSAGWGEM